MGHRVHLLSSARRHEKSEAPLRVADGGPGGARQTQRGELRFFKGGHTESAWRAHLSPGRGLSPSRGRSGIVSSSRGASLAGSGGGRCPGPGATSRPSAACLCDASIQEEESSSQAVSGADCHPPLKGLQGLSLSRVRDTTLQDSAPRRTELHPPLPSDPPPPPALRRSSLVIMPAPPKGPTNPGRTGPGDSSGLRIIPSFSGGQEEAPGGRSHGSLPGRSQGPPPIADRPGTDRASQVTSSGRRAPGQPCTSAGQAPPRQAGLGTPLGGQVGADACGRFGRLRTLRFSEASEALKPTIPGDCAPCGRFGRLLLNSNH